MRLPYEKLRDFFIQNYDLAQVWLGFAELLAVEAYFMDRGRGRPYAPPEPTVYDKVWPRLIAARPDRDPKKDKCKGEEQARAAAVRSLRSGLKELEERAWIRHLERDAGILTKEGSVVMKLPQLQTVKKLRAVGLQSARKVAATPNELIESIDGIGISGRIEIRKFIPYCSEQGYRRRKKREAEALQGTVFSSQAGRRQAC